MRRRTFLRSLGVAGCGVGVGTATGHPNPTDDGTTTTTASPATGDGPLGTLSLSSANELVTSDDGHTAYVATGTGVALVDVVSPTTPRLLAERTELLADSADGAMQSVQDVAVSGDRLVAAGPAHPVEGAHGVVIFDVSDREDPQQVAAYETETHIHNCDFDGQYAYLTGNGRSDNPLVVIDTDTGEEVGTWSLLDDDEGWADVDAGLRSLHDVQVQGDYAYLAHWDAGTWILDIADPSAISLVARVRGRNRETLAAVSDTRTERVEPPGNDHFVTVNDDATVLGIGSESWDLGDDDSGGPSGIELFDISDPTEPESLATIDPPPTSDPSLGGVLTTAHNFELTGGRCYSSWYNGGVTVHDIRDPTEPVERYQWRDSESTSFWTAQRGAGCFLASTTEALDSDITPGVYTFPDPAEETEESTEQASDGGRLGVAGVGAAIVAAGVAAWRLRRRE